MTVAIRSNDNEINLLRRSHAVVPGGIHGHQDVKLQWPGAPQFFSRGEGPYIWDVSGNRYIDLLCSYGPIILGHRHPAVEAAVGRQMLQGDCLNTPSPLFVDLAERLVSVVDHADWAMFMKNGSDATTLALTIARAATGRKKILVARGAYHGATPWCTPNMNGIPEEERANLVYYSYNDTASVDEAVARAGSDLAGIIVSPFRHDAGLDQELVDVAFARHLRAVCDTQDALLILDDVRCGFRLAFGSSWEPIGVKPDLSAWSKAIANGYPLAALLGNDRARNAASSVWAAGSFWFTAVPMAASLATLDVLEKEDGVSRMNSIAATICSGMADQAASLGLKVNVTGQPTMPYLTFAGETDREWTVRFAAECARRGLYTHPRHNWFVSTAITEQLASEILDITGQAFQAVKRAGAPT
ncbi:MAG: aminotransferase class III-fold pyridoxal phosphate-dependent enzyme [Mesorhizobium sp.]|uniref:aminotransferase class III-fold pyridoxal phosphate-dependent enzyme n=1 Tax=Mesorhizobium sp. TaxID=1871066 RepID=UPI0012166086|nr:aminotransferase class III-fold pyridoxal phosphate-dependent enzyme [Mesorhizobium sp.]TIN95533.1 MAG: aminotransferase class III-fold pyridoxal phosphate-dependent enzyme [Mesorhizobium sp.]TJU97180.1 MAG: aminotransferase class III-fold pyridoxal phosphate-dependent enzyme [Mesorhizobium sp.]